MTKWKSILGSAAGNVVEWYDFSLYGFMAPVLAKLFFPSGKPGLALVATYLIFAVSILMRPLGSLIYGYFGDTRGRKHTLIYSLLAMGIPTIVLGLLPTYHSIGVTATILLLLVRLVEGFSAGGELGGSVTFLIESADQNKRGLYGSYAIAAAMVGVFLAGLAATLIQHAFNNATLMAWGWRIPFLCGALLIAVGAYLRIAMRESPEFSGVNETNFYNPDPVKKTIKKHWRSVLKAAEVVALGATLNYLVIIYLPTFLQGIRGFKPSTVLGLSTVALAVVFCMCIVGGILARYFSRRIALQVLAIIVLILAWPVSYVFAHGSLHQVAMAQLLCAAIEGLYFGLQMTFLVGLFPIGVRFTALSIGYNIGYAIFAGLPPLVAAYLIRFVSPTWVFFWILLVTALISATSLIARNLPRMVFIPGLCFDKTFWRYQLARFRDAYNCKVWLVSSKHMEKNCQRLMKKAGSKPFFLIAHSTLGVGVGLAAAASYPEQVKKLVCFPGWVKPNEFTCDFLRQSIKQVEDGQFDVFKRTLRDFAVGEEVKDRDNVLKIVKKIQDGVSAEQMIRQCYLLLEDADVTDLLPKIKADTLVVNSAFGDPFFSKEEAEQLSAALKNGMTTNVQNSGHLIPVTAPSESNALIEMWLTK